MNKYETIFIINPNVEDTGAKALIEKFSTLINSDGKVESVEELGKKKLAYEIQKMSDGFFYFIQFDAPATAPALIEHKVRIMDNVLRFLCVKKDEA